MLVPIVFIVDTLSIKHYGEIDFQIFSNHFSCLKKNKLAWYITINTNINVWNCLPVTKTVEFHILKYEIRKVDDNICQIVMKLWNRTYSYLRLFHAYAQCPSKSVPSIYGDFFCDFTSTHSKNIVIILDTKLNRGFYSMEHEKPDNLRLQFDCFLLREIML